MNCIYIIHNIVSDKVYVGQTSKSSPRDRWAEHCYLLRKGSHFNRHLQCAWGLYGEASFEFFVLDEGLTKQEVDQAERGLRSWYSDLGLCYNITEGGEGAAHSEETRERLRQANLGKVLSEKHRKKISRSSLGKVLSEEHRQKIAESCKGQNAGKNHPMYGRSHTDEAKEKMRRGNLGRVISETTKEKMRAAALGKRPTEETRAKLREARARQVRRPHSEDTRQKMRQAWVIRKAQQTQAEESSP